MYRSSSLADRLFDPAIRLMARLRFRQKALLIGASFTLTCGVLAGLVLTRSMQEMSDVRTSRSAAQALTHLHDALLAMQDHRQLRARRQAKDPTAGDPAIVAAAERTNKALAAFAGWEQASDIADPELEAAMQATQAAWNKALGSRGADGVTADTAALDALRKQMGRLTFAAITGNISDPSMLRAGDVAGEWMPSLSEATAQQALVGIRVLGEGAIWVDDRTALAVSKSMQSFLTARIQDDVVHVQKLLAEGTELFGTPVRAAQQGIAAQNSAIQAQVLDAETPNAPIAGLARRDAATRLAMHKAMKGATLAVAAAGSHEVARLQRRATLTACTVLFALLLAAYMFIGFTRGTRQALQRIETGARALASGQFAEHIRIDTRDELNEIGRSMEGMAASLRSFAQAQQTLFQEHQAGNIDERIDDKAFPGAFGVMADEINTLVDSHIAVKFQLVDIITGYAQGDLSRDMERLPGKKAQVTAAADAFKARMQAVNAEIKALVDAAVAGDFSHRGDAANFEFVYREIVDGLNLLMATADGSLNEVGTLLAAVADGDLSRRVETELPGQFGQLAQDANRTVGNLAQIVGEIRTTSDAISAAAGEIASGNNDLSMRTEQQAASLEETASSMEELTSTVKQNADNARQANQLAIGAAGVAGSGGEVVEKVVHTMGEIQASSRRIAEIIGVIDGIAFQTNILALNAAVEAARAGEQGRGFAVVAAEVRSLAQRSAGAAKEIKQLITDSVMKVEEGSALVDKAGRTMSEIVGSVKRVTDIMADISAASQEQSSGIEQVNQAITQMDEGTQQNAALVEEASASAESLRQQAAQLVDAVAAFQIGTASAPARSAPMQVAPAPEPMQVAAPDRRMARKPVAVVAAPATRKSGATGTAQVARGKRNASGNGAAGDQHWQEF